MLKAHGVEMCAFGSSINFHDPEKLPAMLEEGRRAIDVCQNMGIPHIRVFGDRIPEGRTADEAAQLAADGIRQLCAYADGADVEDVSNLPVRERIGRFKAVPSASCRAEADAVTAAMTAELDGLVARARHA